VRNEQDQLGRLLKLLFEAQKENREVTNQELRTISIDVSTRKGVSRLTSKMHELRKRFDQHPESGWKILEGVRRLEPRF